MQTDKELLELAALAIGLEYFTWCGDGMREQAVHGVPHCGHQGEIWNPLGDDGDAFRLMVDLGIFIDPYGNDIRCGWVVDQKSLACRVISGDAGTDKLAAVRRCITRAAAEIGICGVIQ